MAIKVSGTVVVDDGRAISNVTNVSATDANFSGTGAVRVPTGTTAEQPSSPISGMLRYNTTTNSVELYDNSGSWVVVGTSKTKLYYFGALG